MKILHHKLRIFYKNIWYIKKKTFHPFQMDKKKVTMHFIINELMNFNEFI
jgi:hypothetical protein